MCIGCADADSEAMRKRELKASKTLSELEGKFNATAVQDAMAYFEGKSAEIGLVDFCISFALKKRPEDAAKINVHRRILQTFWKEFQAAAKDGNLPAGVVNGTNRNWAGRGKKYRELVSICVHFCLLLFAEWSLKGILGHCKEHSTLKAQTKYKTCELNKFLSV